jgi:2-polyprenyl-3-methyl-5-hydroxy-6-metoxy-1,4-benzoquinol methylase
MNKIETKHLYDKSYINKLNKQSDLRIRRLLKYLDLNNTQVVADIGCGDGKLAKLICSKVKLYYGFDFSSDFINIAKKDNSELHNANFTVENIIDFCLSKPDEFDKVFTLDFSEHVDDSDFLEIYSAIYKSLNEKGELIIHTPNSDYILEWLKKVGILKQFPQHIAVRNKEEYLYMLNIIGFEKINVIFLSHYIPVLRFLHLFTFLPVIGRFFKARLLIICKK